MPVQDQQVYDKALMLKCIGKAAWLPKEVVLRLWLPARIPTGHLPAVCPNVLSIPSSPGFPFQTATTMKSCTICDGKVVCSVQKGNCEAETLEFKLPYAYGVTWGQPPE